MEEFEELKPDKKPAINISIQSWATPIVGLIMLVIGIYGGYFLRPTNSNPQVQEVVPQATTATQPQDTAAAKQEIMDFLLSQQRHSIGNPEAPVTLIGFSDFQ